MYTNNNNNTCNDHYNNQMQGQNPSTVYTGNGVYEQQRYIRELEKYNNRLLAKMQGLQRVPNVSYKMIEDAIAMNLSQMYNVPVTVWTFARLVELPQTALWRHTCVYTGVTAGQVIDFTLYTTPVKFVVCTGCGKVIYYTEKQEQTYV